MPVIKIERIVSFTSEDPNHVANNILLKDTLKKWKSKVAGEKNASVVLQLDQPYVISGIDIGNEHSAYIEVLVARSTLPEDYKVLLVMSSFMTPLEARQSQNVNKVRMFKQEDFSESEKNEKWDRVMIVCTQPFNRHVQYGLSFVNLYTNDKNLEGSREPLIGKFVIRPESPDNISMGSLFARRKELQERTSEEKLKGAAAIREATSLAHIVSPAVKNKLTQNLPLNQNYKTTDPKNSPKPRNRKEILYDEDEEDEHESKKQEGSGEKNFVSKDTKKREASLETSKEERKNKRPHKNISIEVESKVSRDDKNKNNPQSESNKRKHDDKIKHGLGINKKKIVKKPFSRLLEDVVLVISGIQNPERASLRSMALSMGAKYKTDWNNTCTHLICAFANTPKFNQVKGKGKIIKKNWLEDCYNQKKRLPWRRYALNIADQSIESEEEIWGQEDAVDSENSTRESDTDIDMKEIDSDTEDKIQQIRKKQKHTPLTETFQTDTENKLVIDDSHSDLKIQHKINSFFNNKSFYVDKEFEDQMKKKIKQYIVAYKGTIVENLQAAVDIVITNKLNHKNLKNLCSNAVCIVPDWIWECHNCQKVVSMDDYVF